MLVQMTHTHLAPKGGAAPFSLAAHRTVHPSVYIHEEYGYHHRQWYIRRYVAPDCAVVWPHQSVRPAALEAVIAKVEGL